MGQSAEQSSAKVTANLKASVSAARNLSFAAAGFSGHLNGAVGATAAIAENIAKASKNASIAASATGIGAVVAVIATIAAATINWREETKEVANKVRDVKNATAQLEAQAAGNKRLERELAIQGAMDGEIDAAKKMEHFYRKFPELQDAIRRKAEASRKAVNADVNRAFSDERFDIQSNIQPVINGTDRQREWYMRQLQLQHAREARLRKLDEKGYNADQIKALQGDIEEEFTSGMRDLRYDLDAPARELGDQLGRSIAGSIADGIAAAIKSHSFSAGFRALTGGILAGFGQMLQDIGTQALLGAQLFKALVDSLRSFSPEGAIASALALIAFGGILKGVGSSIASGGGQGGGVGASRSGSSLARSVVAVAPSTSAGGISAGGPAIVNFQLIGPRDPALQRELTGIVRGGFRREGVKI